MTNNPSNWKSPNRPVEQVTWHDANLYCQRLTQREQVAGRLPVGWAYRLPTEAEWEYACRAATSTSYYFGNDGNRLPYYAWVSSNSGGYTHPVGSRAPNRWGLYDTLGNVREWCSDCSGPLYGGNVTDPQGPESGWGRVVRGGSWNDPGGAAWAQARWESDPSSRDSRLGFRVVLAPVP